MRGHDYCRLGRASCDRSVRVRRDHLAGADRSELPPGWHGDRALDEVDAAVTQQGIHSPGMIASSRHGGIRRPAVVFVLGAEVGVQRRSACRRFRVGRERGGEAVVEAVAVAPAAVTHQPVTYTLIQRRRRPRAQSRRDPAPPSERPICTLARSMGNRDRPRSQGFDLRRDDRLAQAVRDRGHTSGSCLCLNAERSRHAAISADTQTNPRRTSRSWRSRKTLTCARGAHGRKRLCVGSLGQTKIFTDVATTVEFPRRRSFSRRN